MIKREGQKKKQGYFISRYFKGIVKLFESTCRPEMLLSSIKSGKQLINPYMEDFGRGKVAVVH